MKWLPLVAWHARGGFVSTSWKGVPQTYRSQSREEQKHRFSAGCHIQTNQSFMFSIQKWQCYELSHPAVFSEMWNHSKHKLLLKKTNIKLDVFMGRHCLVTAGWLRVQTPLRSIVAPPCGPCMFCLCWHGFLYILQFLWPWNTCMLGTATGIRV